tara:strand:- start:217 stop:927 length:711 start_codon:yes stop_codon:yes gene_type:complete
MSEKEFDVYFSLDEKKLNIGVFKKFDNSLFFLHEDILKVNSINEYTNFEELEVSIGKSIRKVEKNINEFVNNIFLMIDTNETMSIHISLMKKLDNKKIQKKDIQHLIYDAKQQINSSYPGKDIIHIIVHKYIINDLDYDFVPEDINCNKISLDIEFICFPKNLIKKVEGLFNNFQISVNKVICSHYAKLFFNNRFEENICEIGRNLNKGFNKKEVAIIPKKVEKKGFFEKLFHLFK